VTGAARLLTLPLTAPGTFVVLVALAVVGAVVWRRAGHRRRRAIRITGLALAIVGLTATAADATNAWFGYLPRLGDAGSLVGAPEAWPVVSAADLARGPASPRARTGGVLSLHLPDRGSGFGPTTALAWLPPQYFTQPTRRFAVVYLAHGSPGVPVDWFRGGEAASLGAQLAARGLPLILVAPRLSHGWLDDPECVDGRHERVATHLLVDVVPGVDAALRTAPVRGARLIGGMSAGGYCALNTGLRHPDVFGSVLDLSGFDRPTHRGGVRALYDGDAVARARADSPGVYARSLRPDPPVFVWLGFGAQDGATAPGLRRLDADLRAAGFPVRLLVRPGFHTFRVWRPLTRLALDEAAPALVAAAG
jgi:enterochelin esterase-like enzyme